MKIIRKRTKAIIYLLVAICFIFCVGKHYLNTQYYLEQRANKICENWNYGYCRCVILACGRKVEKKKLKTDICHKMLDALEAGDSLKAQHILENGWIWGDILDSCSKYHRKKPKMDNTARQTEAYKRPEASLPQIITTTEKDVAYVPSIAAMPHLKSTLDAKINRALGDFVEQIKEAYIPGTMLMFGQAIKTVGDWTGNESIKKAGELVIYGANRTLQFMRNENKNLIIPLNDDELEPWTVYGATGAIMQALQFSLVYTAPSAVIPLMTAQVSGGSAVDGLDIYKEQNHKNYNIPKYLLPEGEK